jgi:3-hydroxyisobutyrate dehydrogenase-like beta-hydroxyacid dehydrogenase
MKIGFVGLGQMGGAIARNLLKAGHELTVWNRSAGRADALVAEGAAQARTPAGAAGGDLVFTMLANDAAVEAVTLGTDGIASGRALHVGMSTISPDLADRLAQAGRYISAPVFGRPAAAEAVKLFVVAAGDPAAIDQAAPAFDAIGQRVFRVGERPSLANLVKLCGNFTIMGVVEALGEAMTLAEKGGVAKQTLLEVLTGTIFDAPVFHVYGDIIAGDKFRPAGFAAPLGLKDMNLVAQEANDRRVPMPALAAIRNHLLQGIAKHGEEIDWSVVAKVIAENAGA